MGRFLEAESTERKEGDRDKARKEGKGRNREKRKEGRKKGEKGETEIQYRKK